MVESFHHKLNNIIEFNHPRLSILIERLKDISIQYYKKYISKLFKDNDEASYCSNVFDDIYNFLKKFLKKFNNSININLLIQDIGERRNNYETITLKILKYFYSINESKEDENEDDENSGENI